MEKLGDTGAVLEVLRKAREAMRLADAGAPERYCENCRALTIEMPAGECLWCEKPL